MDCSSKEPFKEQYYEWHVRENGVKKSFMKTYILAEPLPVKLHSKEGSHLGSPATISKFQKLILIPDAIPKTNKSQTQQS